MSIIEHLSSAVGAAALLPAVLALWLVVAADKRPEPQGIVVVAIALGVAGLLVLRGVRLPFEALTKLTGDHWLDLWLGAVFAIALPEEIVKVLAIALIAWRARAFDEPMDGLVYGAAVGLGFAGYENLGYLMRHTDDLAVVGAIRGLLTVPLHAALGAIAGGCIAQARFGGALGRRVAGFPWRPVLYAMALVVPVLLHGVYDFLLLALRRNLAFGPSGQAWLQAGALCTAVVSIATPVWFAMRVAARQRPPGANRHVLWATFLASCVVGLAGAALVAAALRRLLTQGGASFASAGLGLVLLACAGVLFVRSRRIVAK